MEIQPDEKIYKKYYEFKAIKEEGIKESLARRSQLLIYKHDEYIQDRDRIQFLLDENKRLMLEYGIVVDEQYEMEPVWTEDVNDEDEKENS